jgi:hypothetical protein
MEDSLHCKLTANYNSFASSECAKYYQFFVLVLAKRKQTVFYKQRYLVLIIKQTPKANLALGVSL